MSESQSGFKPVDFCINQLLSTTHDAYQSFDNSLEVRAVFDKVWHKGLLFK